MNNPEFEKDYPIIRERKWISREEAEEYWPRVANSPETHTACDSAHKTSQTPSDGQICWRVLYCPLNENSSMYKLDAKAKTYKCWSCDEFHDIPIN